MTERLEEIGRRIKVLRKEISVLEDEQDALKQDAAGVHVGDVVTVYKRGGISFDVLVDRVNTNWDKPWIWGFKRKKDGEWGSQSHAYYSDWAAKP